MRSASIVKHFWWLIPFVIFDVWFFPRFWQQPEPEIISPEQVRPPIQQPPRYAFPTDQKGLLDPPSDSVFMPTAADNVESALFGSARTRQYQFGLAPAFHEGIDIAPLQRDRRGNAMDKIYAAADGLVAYINRIAGNSSYGRYVVIEHTDPAGPLYTLYAHMDASAPGLKAGDQVTMGQTIGRMGHTSTLDIPKARSHLHFEVGLMLNRRFGQWYKAKKLKPYHNVYHGWNMLGLDPLDLFRNRNAEGQFELLKYTRSQTPAFELIVQAPRFPDYFEIYPALWEGPRPGDGLMRLVFTESGLILSGRPKSESDIDPGTARAAVQNVSAAALGRNGKRLIIQRNGQWQLGSKGTELLEILFY